MIEVIRLDRVNELLEEYNSMKNEGESFSEFIRVSKCLFDDYDVEDKRPLFDWENVKEENLIEVREDE